MRKTLRSILLVTLCTAGLVESPAMSQTAADTPSKGLASPGANIAILDLFNLSSKSEYDSWKALWGRGIRRAVFAHKELKVIAFPYIHQALTELKIDDYYIPPEQVPPLGKKLGADFVVLGSFTVTNNMIAASLKVVDGKTGRLLKEETRFTEASKPNEFIEDLSNTLLKILLGPDAAAAPQPAPAVAEVATDQTPPTVQVPPEASPAPAGQPVPSEPEIQSPPPVSPPPAEIVGPEEIEGSPVGVPVQPAPAAAPAPEAVVVQPAPPAPSGGPQTVVKPIEAEIPSLPRTGDVPPQAVQSPFQPMPVLPAPPPAPKIYTPPAQPQMPMVNPQMAQPGMGYRPPQQPQPQPYVPPAPVEQPGKLRRFFNWVSRPFRPAENLPPPQVNPPVVQQQAAPVSPQMRQQPVPQTMQPQPAPTPAPSGNAVTRFFGRMFGRGQ